MATSGEHADRPAVPPPARNEPASPAEVLQRLAAFDGPPEAFLANLLSVQCSLAGASGGALLRPVEGNRMEPVAVYPPPREGQTAPSWLAQLVEMAGPVLQSVKTTVRPLPRGDELYGEGAGSHLILVPLRTEQGPIGVSGFFVEGAGENLGRIAERLELTSGLLATYTLRQRLQRRDVDLRLLKQAIEALAVVNERKRFAAAAMAMCNQLTTQWNAERASIGFLQGKQVKLKAMSHTEKFTRNMQLVQAIEAAMEESLDQDLEILYPADDTAPYVARAAKTLGTQHGPSAVVSLPMRLDGEVVAVLTIERSPDQPFSFEDVETLRLTADLITPRLVELHRHDRWFGARLAGRVRDAAGVVIGPKHTWAKLAVLLVAGLLAFAFLTTGTYEVEAPFTLEPETKHVVPATIDNARLEEVNVEVGDVVQAGQVLAKLRTAPLEDDLTTARENELAYMKQADIAREAASRNEATYAEVQLAETKLRGVRAEIRNLQRQIREATLRAPIDGTVIRGDLKKRVDGTVEKGEVLFEIAPIESLRAELRVDESDIADLQPGDTGLLATTGAPGERVSFTILRIDPVAEVVGEENIFRVRAVLDTIPPNWKPGMEGVAKVELGERTYAWLLTHDLIDWVRMKFWW